MHSTRVLWLTIITLMAVLTACAGAPQAPTAVSLTTGTEAAGTVPENPSVGYVTATSRTAEIQAGPSLRVDMEYHQMVDELLALTLLLGIIAFGVKSFAQGIFRVINDSYPKSKR